MFLDFLAGGGGTAALKSMGFLRWVHAFAWLVSFLDAASKHRSPVSKLAVKAASLTVSRFDVQVTSTVRL